MVVAGCPVAELQLESNVLSIRAEIEEREKTFMTNRMTTEGSCVFKVQQKRGRCPFLVQFIKFRGT
jgi:hypothetical protein